MRLSPQQKRVLERLRDGEMLWTGAMAWNCGKFGFGDPAQLDDGEYLDLVPQNTVRSLHNRRLLMVVPSRDPNPVFWTLYQVRLSLRGADVAELLGQGQAQPLQAVWP